MKKLIVIVAIFACVYGLGVLLFPPFRHTVFLVQLLRDTMPGNIPIPVAGIKQRQLTDTWGAARSGGRKHEGIDIFAKRGTPVLSSTKGIVYNTGVDVLGGKVVRVLGPGGYIHYYAHLEDYGTYSSGDAVDIGDTLGFVGDSGNARGTPPHLHYGIYERTGTAINPYPYLKKSKKLLNGK